ncbi:hypothetical protein DFP72DRAFT_1003964 [Ephemerocybe angulata]|uniref:Queuosine 5'-phosphate N-glycosylase/hydrolase n=1 Tax=Ephemerocybe angulata TaxID=980116 RepID=A0A8H6IA08_9AGAR|nr:hypothetical protein DFP72DRAFT_1003964 [Tulosesus angulatus]
MSDIQLPASGSYVSSIRESSQKLCQASQISIRNESIERLLLSNAFKSTYDRLTTLPGVALPLNFASPLDELNLLSILALLSFGSSYDAPVREQTGHGAFNAIRALVFSMYITSTPSEGDHLSAEGMKAMSSSKVAELMGVNMHVEKPHDTIPGVVLGSLEGPVFDFVQLVTGVLHETGAVLLDAGYPNLGFLVVEALKEGEKAKSSAHPDADIDIVIERLARALPAFRDMTIVDGDPVYIFSKAIYLLNVIHTRFGSKSPSPFPVPGVQNLPISADGANSSLLLHLDILDLSLSPSMATISSSIVSDEATVKSLLDQSNEGAQAQVREGVLLDLQQAYRLRAAVVTACERFPEVAKNLLEGSTLDITVPRINVWLQSIQKERSDYRAFGAIVAKDHVSF